MSKLVDNENIAVNTNIPEDEKVAKKGTTKKAKSDTKKNKKETKKDQAKTKDSQDEANAVDIVNLMSGIKISDKVEKAMNDIREPTDVGRLQESLKQTAWDLKSLCDGYKFDERGALFSSDLNHNACDIHLHLVRSGKGNLPQEDCQTLYDAARNQLEHSSPVLVQWVTSDGKTQEAFGPQHLKKENITSIIISGTKKIPGAWILPITIEISIAHSKKHSSISMEQISDTLDKGDFATVILQLHEFFKNKKKLREQFAQVYNEYIGRLRFLVTQFEMMDQLGNKFKDKRLEYIQSTIGGLALDWYEKEPSTKTMNDLLQKRAGAILKAHHDDYVSHIKPSSQRDIFEQAYKRTLGRSK
mmetsp:Transcript_17545/g.22881  ORF Transcript_17545/g.22881 Transcript_17545/m.22881 type:complete len:358 (+) Transcript_17545:114-1187(+)